MGSHMLYTRITSQIPAFATPYHLIARRYHKDDSIGLCLVLAYTQSRSGHVLTPSGKKFLPMKHGKPRINSSMFLTP